MFTAFLKYLIFTFLFHKFAFIKSCILATRVITDMSVMFPFNKQHRDKKVNTCIYHQKFENFRQQKKIQNF